MAARQGCVCHCQKMCKPKNLGLLALIKRSGRLSLKACDAQNLGHNRPPVVGFPIRKLKELLTKKGAKVLMTREIDDSLDDHIPNNGSRHREDLNSRVKIVNNSKVDILLSIHVNHNKNANKIGPIIFYNTRSEESKYFANHIQEYLNNLSSYKEIDIGTKHKATPGDYYLLRNISPPGVIIEMGFISNESDRRLLLDNKHLDEIVELITKGIIDYFNADR